MGSSGTNIGQQCIIGSRYWFPGQNVWLRSRGRDIPILYQEPPMMPPIIRGQMPPKFYPPTIASGQPNYDPHFISGIPAPSRASGRLFSIWHITKVQGFFGGLCDPKMFAIQLVKKAIDVLGFIMDRKISQPKQGTLVACK